MSTLNLKTSGLSILFLFTFWVNLNAQRPKKIFKYIKENKIDFAINQYNICKKKTDYNQFDKLKFDLAECLILIDNRYEKYDCIMALKKINSLSNQYNSNTKIAEFLLKFDLSTESLYNKVNREAYDYALKKNSLDLYKNTFDNISEFYKKDIENHLYNLLHSSSKFSRNITELNFYIDYYPKSSFRLKTIELRDSIEYIKSLEENKIKTYSSYIQKYPSSRWTENIKVKIDSLTFIEVINTNTLIAYKKFIEENPKSKWMNAVKFKDDSLAFNISQSMNTIDALKNYIATYPNGVYKENALKIIDSKTLTYEKIISCYSLDTLNLFLNCENLLTHSKVYLYQVCLVLSINKLKEDSILKDVKKESLAKTIFKSYQELIESDKEYANDNIYSEQIVNEIKRYNDINLYMNNCTCIDSIYNLYIIFYEFGPYLRSYSMLNSGNRL